MTIASKLKIKSTNKAKLLSSYNLKDKKQSLGYIKIKNDLVDQFLIDALKILPANFIIYGKNKDFGNNQNIAYSTSEIINSGFDFIVCDDELESLMKYLKDGVVPIIFKNHHMVNLLKEFNAKKVEGNAFVFENNSLCDIYYAIIRFIENYKFPYDHKALVKNVLEI